MDRINEEEEKECFSLVISMTSNQDFWSQSNGAPSRIGFQRFGMQLREEDFEQGDTTYRGFLIRDRSVARKDNSGFSEVQNKEEEFSVQLDVWPFKYDELVVMVVCGLYILIDGEHSEKCEDNGTCSRKLTRRYLLPKGFVSETMKANYWNGTLTIWGRKDKIVETATKATATACARKIVETATRATDTACARKIVETATRAIATAGARKIFETAIGAIELQTKGRSLKLPKLQAQKILKSSTKITAAEDSETQTTSKHA